MQKELQQFTVQHRDMTKLLLNGHYHGQCFHLDRNFLVHFYDGHR